ncbi:MAG: hypothetical protein GEU95_13395 [Rhizobiales bacterium]|nr:hypothetical protein [Hyphomicrobiales bacterium]
MLTTVILEFWSLEFWSLEFWSLEFWSLEFWSDVSEAARAIDGLWSIAAPPGPASGERAALVNPPDSVPAIAPTPTMATHAKNRPAFKRKPPFAITRSRHRRPQSEQQYDLTVIFLPVPGSNPARMTQRAATPATGSPAPDSKNWPAETKEARQYRRAST